MAGGQRPPAREVEQEEVTLIPDRKEYQPGDTAEILVQAPFFPAEGLLTLRRSGIVASERFAMAGPTTRSRVPIEEAFIPNLHVQVDLVGAAARDRTTPANRKPDAPKRPAFASGELDLPVPPLARTLDARGQPARREARAGRRDDRRRGRAGRRRAGRSRAPRSPSWWSTRRCWR